MDDSVQQPQLEPTERPTLKTIARLSGLAVATVSRALNDAPDIGAATKRRVHEIAESIGYRPNRAGVRLRTGKTNVISLVLCTDHEVMNHTARLISSVAGALRQTPYHLIVTPYFSTEDPMNPIRYIVETHSADGVIINQTKPFDPRVAYLMKNNFPFATHGRTNWHREHPYFDFDNGRFAEIAMAEFASRGRRDVLLVAPPLGQNYAQNFVEGARIGADRHGLRMSILDGATSDSGSAELELAFGTYLAANPQTDGVICVSAGATMAIVARAEAEGRVIGGDLDVFSKEAIPFLRRFRAPILTVSEDVTRAGVFLARAVMQRIAEPGLPPMQALDTPSI